MTSNTNQLYNELKMIAKMGKNIKQRNPRKQTNDQEGKMDKIEFNVKMDRLHSPMAMTGFPSNPSMYATKTTAMKPTSTYDSVYGGKKLVAVQSEQDSILNGQDQNNGSSMYSIGEWNINLNSNSFMNYNQDSHINLQTDEHLFLKNDNRIKLEEIKENLCDNYDSLKIIPRHTQRVPQNQSSIFDDIDNDFSYRDRGKDPDQMKNWVNISDPNNNNRLQNRCENCRKKLINESCESYEAEEERKYSRHIVSKGTAVIVKSKHSKMSSFYQCIVNTLLCKWMFRRKTPNAEQILNKHKVRKSKTMKRLKVNTVRHQNSRHLSDVTHSNEVKIKIVENNNTFAPQISNETMNVNLFIDNLSSMNQTNKSYLEKLKEKFIRTHAKVQSDEEKSNYSSSESELSDFLSISGSLKACELWNKEDIVAFCNPKDWDSDKHIVIPSGKEENEDMTFLETDSLVDVAPSRMSTYKGGNQMGKNATIVVKNGRYLPGDKWSCRLDMLLIQAHEQFPGNWQKISRLIGSKKEPKECSERYEILSSLSVQGHFSKEEDEILRNAFEKYGKNWALIAKKCFKGRTAKQIRDHYMNTINKNINNQNIKAFDHSETIHEISENNCEFSPSRNSREIVQIQVSSLAPSPERRNQCIRLDLNQTITRENVLRQITDSSIFTDESLKEEMKCSDQSWYNRLGSTNNNQHFGDSRKEITKLGSKEQYKEMMSNMSNENNDQIMHGIIGKMTVVNNSDCLEKQFECEGSHIFKSKQTFQ